MASSELSPPPEVEPLFDPPLYKQRYAKVAEILRKNAVQSVADLGCAELKFIKHIRNLPSLERIVGLDIDAALLKDNHQLLRPLVGDYIDKRPSALTISLFHGDLTRYDTRLSDIQAVTMIEVVEHLEEDTLNELPVNVFGVLQPELVVMTTPNSEYNVVFPNFSGFRHPDHKFEWTREQFQSWCNTLSSTYGYEVHYEGIGAPPSGQEEIGFCSQMALFERSTPRVRIQEPETKMSYNLVSEYVYPHVEAIDPSAALLMEAEYIMRLLMRETLERETDWAIGEEIWLPLETILGFHKIREMGTDAGQLSDVLRTNGYKINNDRVLIEQDDSDSDNIDYESQNGSQSPRSPSHPDINEDDSSEQSWSSGGVQTQFSNSEEDPTPAPTIDDARISRLNVNDFDVWKIHPDRLISPCHLDLMTQRQHASPTFLPGQFDDA